MNLLTNLFDHQKIAVEKLKPTRIGALFMEMGTGKTRCAIELVNLRESRIDKVIWFCPVSLKETITFEIKKHTDSENIYIFDNKISVDNIPNCFWYIVGIESMSSSSRVIKTVSKLITVNTYVILDESDKIKTHYAKRSKIITYLSEKAKYRLLLTGTPITNSVADLFSQMKFLSPKILGYHSFYSFAANHLEYSEKYPGLVIRAHNTDWLAAKINPYVYQITKEEAGLNLPKKLFDSRYYNLTHKQFELYEYAKETILGTCEDFTSYTIFQLFTALQQIVSGFWNGQEIPHSRLNVLENILSLIPENEKVIIWCKYQYSVEKAAEMVNVSPYYGGSSEMEKSKILDDFRHNKKYFVATMATGGYGLTLNEASHVVFYENEFKYAHRIQAEDRNHRIGQTKPVTYIDVISHSKIEDKIMKSLAKKGNLVQDFKRKVYNLKDKNKKEIKQYLMDAL
jgi:SNF2 family DNA or RNA helicase